METSLVFYPTSSQYSPSQVSDGSQFELVHQRAFVFNEEFSSQEGQESVEYLTVDLHEFRGDDDFSNKNTRYNAIYVRGYIMPKNSIVNEDVISFTHKWVTPWITGSRVGNPNVTFQNFEGEFTETNPNNEWTPTVSSGWANGLDCLTATYWDPDERAVIGWQCAGNGAVPGSSITWTGTAGAGVDVNGNPPNTPNTSFKAIYTEASAPNDTNNKCWVARSKGVNYSTAMESTGNDLTLRFYVHGWSNGNSQSSLKVYIHNQSAATDSTATELLEITKAGGGGDVEFTQTSGTSPYQEITIDLNAYRTVNSNHYIYFVAQGNTNFRSDIYVDNFSITENPIGLVFDSNFTQQLVVGSQSTLVTGGSTKVYASPLGNEDIWERPYIRFYIQKDPAKDIYVKGTYLLI